MNGFAINRFQFNRSTQPELLRMESSLNVEVSSPSEATLTVPIDPSENCNENVVIFCVVGCCEAVGR